MCRFWGRAELLRCLGRDARKNWILHSRDIRKCDKEFKILFDLDIKKQFYEDLYAIMGQKDAYTAVS